MKTSSATLATCALLSALALTGCSATTTAEPTAQTPQSTPSISETSLREKITEKAAEAKEAAKQAIQGLSDKLSATTTPQPPASVDSAASLAALEALPVKGRAPKTGYARDQFGAAWSDVDHNGCDTRNDILRRDLTGTTAKPGTKNCVIESGTLNDPYTGKTITFKRGAKSSDIQIDHVVALSDAWQTGAQQISSDKRLALANDPDNLLAVDGPTNQAKSDSDAATFLPPNKAYRCTYVSKQVAVKAKYGLWVTQAEHDAIARVLNSCPSA